MPKTKTVFPENTPDATHPYQLIPLDLIDPNPYQPRAPLTDADVSDLARGLALKRETLPETCGLMQLPIARYHVGRYQLAFGHRRFKAFDFNHYNAQKGVIEGDWSKMPLIIHDLDDEQMYDFAARENGDRQDLNDIEKAKSIQLAQDEFEWTLSQAANAHGLSKSAGSNLVRLLHLPEPVQALVASGELGQRHARELVRLAQTEGVEPDGIYFIAEQAVAQGWKVETVGARVDSVLFDLRAAQRRQAAPDACPECGSDQLKPGGLGTVHCEACGAGWSGEAKAEEAESAPAMVTDVPYNPSRAVKVGYPIREQNLTAHVGKPEFSALPKRELPDSDDLPERPYGDWASSAPKPAAAEPLAVVASVTQGEPVTVSAVPEPRPPRRVGMPVTSDEHREYLHDRLKVIDELIDLCAIDRLYELNDWLDQLEAAFPLP